MGGATSDQHTTRASYGASAPAPLSLGPAAPPVFFGPRKVSPELLLEDYREKPGASSESVAPTRTPSRTSPDRLSIRQPYPNSYP